MKTCRPNNLRRRRLAAAALLAAGSALAPLTLEPLARAEDFPSPPQRMIDAKPRMVDRIGIDAKLGNQVPLDATFRDETGKTVRLGDYFGHRPVLLTPVYYSCPMLCTMVLNGVLRSARSMPETVGRDFDIVTFSFDPREKAGLAQRKRTQYLSEYDRDEASNGWHFLTGDEDQIKRVTDALGYRYAYDESVGQYAHASGVMVLTPSGKIAQYLYGIDYAVPELQAAIKAASAENTKGAPTQVVILYCFHYDPATGRVGIIISRALKVGGVGIVLAMGGMIGFMLWKEKHATAPNRDAGATPGTT